jgi:hypothetical protein
MLSPKQFKSIMIGIIYKGQTTSTVIKWDSLYESNKSFLNRIMLFEK